MRASFSLKKWSLHLLKKMESYDHGKCLCYISVYCCGPMYCTTLVTSASVLELFRKHILPFICNDTFSLIIRLQFVSTAFSFKQWRHKIVKICTVRVARQSVFAGRSNPQQRNYYRITRLNASYSICH